MHVIYIELLYIILVILYILLVIFYIASTYNITQYCMCIIKM